MITFETIKETIEFGFDIATAASIIGSALVFGYTTRIKNKKNLQKEKVVEIWDLLIEFNEYFDAFSKEINNYNKAPNPGPLLTKMAELLRVKMLPAFTIFSTKENIDALANMMDETKIIIDVWGDFCEIPDKNKKAHNTVTEAMDKYVDSMIDLDVQLIEYLRNQVHNEKINKSKEVVKLYKKRKYNYREVEFT